MNTKALTQLYKHQAKFNSSAILGPNFELSGQEFPLEAYPETATGLHLESLAGALKIKRSIRNGVAEDCESLRERVLIELSTPKVDESKEVSKL
jgi:hypothetical protein